MINTNFQPDHQPSGVWHTGLETGSAGTTNTNRVNVYGARGYCGGDVGCVGDGNGGEAGGAVVAMPSECERNRNLAVSGCENGGRGGGGGSDNIRHEPVDRSRNKGKPGKGYDPHDFGNAENATSFWGVVTHIIVISFGPTLLSIPSAFVSVGYVTGFLCTVTTVFLYAYCMRMIVSCEYELCRRGRIPNMSYIGTIREAFKGGPAGTRWCSDYVEVVVYAVFLCIWIGGNSIVFLLASNNLKNAYDFFTGTDQDVRLIMAAIVVPLVLLCWIPDLRLLVPVSFLTNVVNVFGICVILYYTLRELPPLRHRVPAGHPSGVPIFVGLLLFTINATGLMIPLKNEMKRPKRFSSKFGVLSVSYAAVTLVYALFGFLCYVKYGDKVEASVIMNLPPTKFCKAVIALYGVGNCCFFPLISYVSFDIVWNDILRSKFDECQPATKTLYEYACRTAIALSSMVFAYIVPNIELFLSLTGTVGTSIDSLIIPAVAQTLICHHQHQHHHRHHHHDQRRRHHKRRIYFIYVKNGLIVSVGLALIVTGCYDFASRIITSF